MIQAPASFVSLVHRFVLVITSTTLLYAILCFYELAPSSPDPLFALFI